MPILILKIELNWHNYQLMVYGSDRFGIGIFDREVVAWIPPERWQNQLTFDF